MPETSLNALLRSLHAVRNSAVVVFCRLPPEMEPGSVPAVGLFRESEGVTVLLEERDAEAMRLTPVFRAAWITLSVHSDLHAVGLTAAIAAALAAEGISCNVVAAVHHDHLFVPIDRADDAIAALDRLQAAAQRPSSS